MAEDIGIPDVSVAHAAVEVVLSPETIATIQAVATSGYWYLTPVAALLSALISALIGGAIGFYVHSRIAQQNNEHQRKIQANRATLDFIANREIDADILKAKSVFNEQRDSTSGFKNFLSNANRDLREHVKTILNDYELTALGIHARILDEDFYKKWFRSGFLKDYHSVAPLIAEIRDKENNENIYAEIERLATTWGAPRVRDVPTNPSA